MKSMFCFPDGSSEIVPYEFSGLRQVGCPIATNFKGYVVTKSEVVDGIENVHLEPADLCPICFGLKGKTGLHGCHHSSHTFKAHTFKITMPGSDQAREV